MTNQEAAIITAYTGVMIGDFAYFHEYVEKILGRHVWTHEMASRAVADEIKAAAKADFLAIEVSG